MRFLFFFSSSHPLFSLSSAIFFPSPIPHPLRVFLLVFVFFFPLLVYLSSFYISLFFYFLLHFSFSSSRFFPSSPRFTVYHLLFISQFILFSHLSILSVTNSLHVSRCSSFLSSFLFLGSSFPAPFSLVHLSPTSRWPSLPLTLLCLRLPQPASPSAVDLVNITQSRVVEIFPWSLPWNP